ncbi:MAG: hypothetical protein HY678_01420 [Chloroflexi bacterium]|nr:hypothetical protein [Chloroflexota bacterium]
MVVGSTTLQPGERRAVELPLLMGMHKGMGGPHTFAIDIRSNDSVEPLKTVRWRFNVTDSAR